MIPFARATVNGRTTSLNAERLINLYAEQASPDSRSPLILRSTPGLSTFGTIGAGPVRGLHRMNMNSAATLFMVTGNDLYEVDLNGAGTLRGSAGTITGTGFVSMASNQNDELVIVNSSGTGWLWDDSTLATWASHDADFTADATNVTFLHQYIIWGKKNTGQVFASDLNDAKTQNALSFATAEAADDNVVWVYAFGDNLWVFGEHSLEVWYNAATSPFAFARLGGAVSSDIGGVANTVADIDNSICWLAQDGIIYRAVGLQPARISTHAVEFLIRDWTNYYAFAYKDEGHAFYALGANEGCVVYDMTTGLWHERESFTVGRWRANNYANVYDKHLVGDHLIGRIYEMSLSNFADGTNALQRRAITPPIHDDGRRVSMGEIQVHFEAGVGLTSGQGSDPQVVLEHSDDGGKTWSNERWESIGKKGEYEKRAIWRRNGSFRQRNYRLTYTEPTKYAILGVRGG